jgi:hypothetical protein
MDGDVSAVNRGEYEIQQYWGMTCFAKLTRVDKKYRVYEGYDDYGDMRVARGISMAMKRTPIGG